jgi:hypothetical protein
MLVGGLQSSYSNLESIQSRTEVPGKKSHILTIATKVHPTWCMKEGYPAVICIMGTE